MKIRTLPAGLALILIAGCAIPIETVDVQTGTVGALPDSVRAIAAPYQDLASARVRPEDGCYWYRHEGPVETTLLPLRTVDGRGICTRPQA